MSDEPLKPALTPDEWRRVGPNGSGHPLTPSLVGDVDSLDHDDSLRVMAVANENLRVGSPHKITRGDVQCLREVIACLADLGKYNTEKVEALAAKLAALLPPSGDTP